MLNFGTFGSWPNRIQSVVSSLESNQLLWMRRHWKGKHGLSNDMKLNWQNSTHLSRNSNKKSFLTFCVEFSSLIFRICTNHFRIVVICIFIFFKSNFDNSFQQLRFKKWFVSLAFNNTSVAHPVSDAFQYYYYYHKRLKICTIKWWYIRQ